MNSAHLIVRLIADESGQDIIEYALLLGIISAGVATTVGALGLSVNGKYGEAANAVDGPGAGPFGTSNNSVTVSAPPAGSEVH